MAVSFSGKITASSAVLSAAGGVPLGGVPAASDPDSNTGSDSQKTSFLSSIEPSVDFLQGTARFSDLASFQCFVDYLCSLDCEGRETFISYCPGRQRYSGIVWQNSVVNSLNIPIAYNVADDLSVHSWFSLSGTFFKSLGFTDSVRFLVGLAYYSPRINRIDLKVRDYARRITPAEVFRFASEGYLRRVSKYEIAGSAFVGCEPAFTTYLGSRKSEKFIRVYDAAFVHDVPAIDWELQLRDERAKVAFAELVATFDIDLPSTADRLSLAASFIAAAVCGAVDFLDGDGKNLDRLRRLDWWQSFIDDCGGVLRLPSGRNKPTVQSTFDWIDRQVITTLSAICDGLGGVSNFIPWLKNSLESARSRYNVFHESFIAQLSSFRYFYLEEFAAYVC